MNTSNKKTVECSKQKFVKALLAVMNIYKFKEITVTQLAQEAGLSRKTFYSLFSDKTQVLELYFENLFNEFLTYIKRERAEDYWGIVKCYFNFFADRKDLVCLLYENNLINCLFEIPYKRAGAIFHFIHPRGGIPETRLHFILAYSVGGMNGMLLKWLESGMTVPADELIAILKESFKLGVK